LWPAPRKEPSAGATNAGDTLHLRTQPLASGTATKRDCPPLFTRISTTFLLSSFAALMASRTSLSIAAPEALNRPKSGLDRGLEIAGLI